MAGGVKDRSRRAVTGTAWHGATPESLTATKCRHANPYPAPLQINRRIDPVLSWHNVANTRQATRNESAHLYIISDEALIYVASTRWKADNLHLLHVADN